MCGHAFIEKPMFITEPAVLSARILDLGSKCILATCRARPTKILLDSYTLSRARQNREQERKALLSHQEVKLSFVSIRWAVKAQKTFSNSARLHVFIWDQENTVWYLFVCLFVFGMTLSFKAILKQMVLDWDQIRFLGNCPPTPPLSQHFAVNEN